MVHQLMSWPKVAQIYCLVRAESDEAAALRLTESFRQARLDDADHEKRSIIVALASDVGQHHLGLDDEKYDALRTSVTDIIHGAWAVNFNMSLKSFEPCLASVSRLLEFSMSSLSYPKPTFSFISSIASVMRAGEQGVVNEARYGWEFTASMGYGQSKWVAEEICFAAAQYAVQKGANLPIQILRVGQVVGDTNHGIWNPTEAIPLTVQSALTIGVLPLIEGDDMTFWLPVDIAAIAVLELALRSRSHDNGQEARIFHISSTTPFRWNTDFLPALKRNRLSFEAIPGREWVCLLESAVPNHLLLQHFKARYGAARDDQSSQRARGAFDTSEAQRYASVLTEVPRIDEKQVSRFLTYWLGLESWRSIQRATNIDNQARTSPTGRRDGGVGT